MGSFYGLCGACAPAESDETASLESLVGVTAPAAQRHHGLPLRETVVNAASRRGVQNLGKLLGQEIAQGDITFVIQAAGDYRTVSQNADLSPQAVAEAVFTAVRRGKIRPVKFVAVL